MRHLMFIVLLGCNAASADCIGDGTAAANSGKYDEAIAHYSKCIKSSPQKAYWGLETKGIDFIQLPSNLLDRRFEDAGIFQLALERKKQIYIRSVFLQGLILMASENIPRNILYAKPIIEQIQTICQESSLKPQEIALGFVKKNMPKAQIIFGAETPSQVRDNLKFWVSSLPLPIFSHIKSTFSQVNEKILNHT